MTAFHRISQTPSLSICLSVFLSVCHSALTAREALAKETMSAGSVFESKRTAVPVSNAGGATHYTEIDTEADRDTRAVLEKNIRLNE